MQTPESGLHLHKNEGLIHMPFGLDRRSSLHQVQTKKKLFQFCMSMFLVDNFVVVVVLFETHSLTHSQTRFLTTTQRETATVLLILVLAPYFVKTSLKKQEFLFLQLILNYVLLLLIFFYTIRVVEKLARV